MDITKNLIKPALVNDARTSLISEIITDGDWNWVRPDNDKIKFDPGIPANYYESTLAPGCLSLQWRQISSVNS